MGVESKSGSIACTSRMRRASQFKAMWVHGMQGRAREVKGRLEFAFLYYNALLD